MQSVTIKLGDESIELQTGRIARQASAAVTVSQRDTVILVTVQSDMDSGRDPGFLPLTVEYREKFAAIGRIPGGFLKREGRITDNEILTSRIIDRSIRPLFPKGLRADTQVIATVLSSDQEVDPGILAILGTSAALHLSEIPWNGPAAGVRVSRLGKSIRLMPSSEERKKAELDFVVASGPAGLSMVEGGANQIRDEEVLEALFAADDAMKSARDTIDGFRLSYGQEKRVLTSPELSTEEEHLISTIESAVASSLREAILTPGKLDRRIRLREVRRSLFEEHASKTAKEGGVGPSLDLFRSALERIEQKIVRQMITTEKRRIDGRGPEDIRNIESEAGWLPRTHGSAIFTRGETQALVSCTLAPLEEAQRIDTLHGETKSSFLLHYNFPPYCVGETSPLRGPGRREIGHGNLARTALSKVLPTAQEFAYTVRIESDITESNGSSSMATVCGGCLALMDAGVPISKPVAGIAMGLVQEGDSVSILSDILGDEDHMGDMDFKVTGTEDGVTAMQMDNKIGGLSREVMEKAMMQAREGRIHILQKMAETLSAPREEVSDRAPRVTTTRIRPERIAELIGPRGSTIQDLQAKTQTRVTVDDSGQVCIFSTDPQKSRMALQAVRRLVGNPEVGKLYKGEVVSVKPFGAFVRIIGKAEGLVHVSELAEDRVEDAAQVTRPGEAMVVRVLGVDKGGRLKLSRKEAMNSGAEEIEF